MDDLISRQAAIDELEYAAWGKEWDKALAKAMLESLPSAQPEPKRGEWIPIRKGERGFSAGDFRCSICHQPNKCYIVTNYCSHCGALMRDK